MNDMIAVETNVALATLNPEEKLPALIAKAQRRLAEAKTSAEVLEARVIAKMALAYAKTVKAANDTQADCIRMVVRAEIRMADEIDAGQASGDVAGKGRPGEDDTKIHLGDLNVDRRRMMEWRQMRDAGEGVINSAIEESMTRGVVPTFFDLKKAARVHLRRQEDGYDEGIEDAVPELPAKPISRPGDVWLLGDHRLMCGDATDPKMVKQLLAADKPHLMVTDPPYGVSYEPEWRDEANDRRGKRKSIQNDDRVDWRAAWALFPGDVAYVWHAGVHAGPVQVSLDAVGFVVRAQIIWVKPSIVLSRGDYHWQHEPMWYAIRKGGQSHWQGDRNQSTVWQVRFAAGEDDATEHGTQKPVEVMRRPMQNNSERGDLVYEPFCGSGSAIMAAESSGRVCLAMELDPAFVDLAVRRWEAATGRKAERAGGTRARGKAR